MPHYSMVVCLLFLVSSVYNNVGVNLLIIIVGDREASQTRNSFVIGIIVLILIVATFIVIVRNKNIVFVENQRLELKRKLAAGLVLDVFIIFVGQGHVKK